MSNLMKCQAITKSGVRCSRDAVDGTKFCKQHQGTELIENSSLTDKQKAFCEEYIIDNNASRAAIAAGYSENTARQIAAENLTKPYIMEEIQRLQDARSKRTEITADRVLKELAIIGYSNITDYLRVVEKNVVVGYEENEDGSQKPVMRKQKIVEIKETDDMDPRAIRAISEIKQTKTGISLKLYDKPKALQDIGRHLGMWNDKLEITEGTKLEDFFD